MADKNWADRLEQKINAFIQSTGFNDTKFAQDVSTLILKTIAWYVSDADFPFGDFKISMNDIIRKVNENREAYFDPNESYKLGNELGLKNLRDTANTVTSVAGGFLALGSWAALAFDIIALIDGMARTSLAIGGVYAKRYGYGPEVLNTEDFLGVVAYWVEEKDLFDDPDAVDAFYKAILGDDAAFKIRQKAELKLSLKGGIKGSVKLGVKASDKAVTKAVVKFISKFNAKMATKASGKAASTAPGIAHFGGCLLNAAINRWFMGQLLDASEAYYDDKFRRMKAAEATENQS
ncbi:MAG: hypothetical protein EAY76_01120 [Alphaproteobacteria bacterium]|nr:MAG: hypothetical protein EAY76_01120 [Alphaproteobacteria bacterium]TAF76983.1 MAG: hypothetical protein EAZ52_02360 [Alphaproteobacteria bacterium]